MILAWGTDYDWFSNKLSATYQSMFCIVNFLSILLGVEGRPWNHTTWRTCLWFHFLLKSNQEILFIQTNTTIFQQQNMLGSYTINVDFWMIHICQNPFLSSSPLQFSASYISQRATYFLHIISVKQCEVFVPEMTARIMWFDLCSCDTNGCLNHDGFSFPFWLKHPNIYWYLGEGSIKSDQISFLSENHIMV